jgi:23S rRNA-intervening sequence protein
MRDYTKIKAWRLADDLTVEVYERTRAFPREEIYGLTSQLRRAAYSVPGNIVEGASREARGTICISSTLRVALYQRPNIFVHFARRLGYLSLEEAEALGQRMKVAFGCLHGLIRAVEKEARKLGQVIASVTSLLVIGLMRWSGGQLSVVS